MIVAVTVVGLFNLALGFACAVLWSQERFRALFGWRDLEDTTTVPDGMGDDKQSAPPQVLMTNDWKKILERLNVATEDPAEASWWVALDLVEQQRQTITQFVSGSRDEQLENSPKQISTWQRSKTKGSTALQRVVDTIHRAELAEVPHTDHLVEVLNRFIESSNATSETDNGPAEHRDQEDLATAEGLASSETSNSASALDSEGLVSQIHNDLDALHDLRDDMIEWLSRDSTENSRFDNIPGKLRIDFATKLYNRAGLEYVVRQFYADTEGQEHASMMLCNVDKCRLLNENYGVYVTDHVLIELARELDKAIRKERGFDRVARLGGQTLAMFLGSTDLDGAERFADRWRMRVENTEFNLNGIVVQLTISTAIINFDFHRTLAENLTAAFEGIAAARAEGGNIGKRIADATVTISTDEPTPEKQEIVLEQLEDPKLGALIPLA